MGNCLNNNTCQGPDTEFCPLVSPHNFQRHLIIGKGGFGKVWRVTYLRTKQPFAMKVMNKARVLEKSSVQSILNERRLLVVLKHPYLVNMHYAFQDKDNLYLVLDLLLGGDLRFHILRYVHFTEEQTRFLVANLVLALEYLHLNGVIHRDVKPENLVFSADGFLHLTDLGVAAFWQEENSRDSSGTPGYMAPEVICRINHTIAADYFAVGVIVYELIMGRRPYLGRNRREIRDAMLTKQAQINKGQLPQGWSETAADFVNQCLQRKAANRLGYRGPQEVKAHPWLSSIDWEAIKLKKVTPPFVPKEQKNLDSLLGLQSQGKNSKCKVMNAKSLFAEYYYDLSEKQAA